MKWRNVGIPAPVNVEDDATGYVGNDCCDREDHGEFGDIAGRSSPETKPTPRARADWSGRVRERS
jgi:hypothetical protein